jgi:predicted N-formylglutamate amidohydrolase
MHSFTPVFHNVVRMVQIGVLYHHATPFSRIMLDLLRGQGDLVVGDNEPYAITDTSDYTAPVHGEARGLDHVEIEIRQDLIAEPAGQAEWAERMARVLVEADKRLRGN